MITTKTNCMNLLYTSQIVVFTYELYHECYLRRELYNIYRINNLTNYVNIPHARHMNWRLKIILKFERRMIGSKVFRENWISECQRRVVSYLIEVPKAAGNFLNSHFGLQF